MKAYKDLQKPSPLETLQNVLWVTRTTYNQKNIKLK